jgi:hypothetical protein
MTKRCPPDMYCIEIITLLCICVGLLVGTAIMYCRSNTRMPPNIYTPLPVNKSRGIVGIPINIKTQGYYNPEYSQIGLLTRSNGSDTLLPLMGRPVSSNRNKWQYYTLSDKYNSIRLPIIVNNRRGTLANGVNELSAEDVIQVEGYGDTFKVTLYEQNTLRYIPYI